MASEETYLNVRASLLRFCTQFIQDNFPNQFSTVDFDAHTSLNDLPDNNVIGISEFVFKEDTEMYEGAVNFMVMTTADDKNLQNLLPAIGKLFNVTLTTKEIEVVDREDATVLGNLIVKGGTTVSPVARNEARPLQGVFVSFGASFLTPP